MKTMIRGFYGVVWLLSIVVLGGIGYWYYSLPDDYLVEQGRTLSVNDQFDVTAANQQESVRAASASVGDSYTASLRWLGIFPVKNVAVTVVEKPAVVLGGRPFGVKLYTDGVLVVSLSEVDGKGGNKHPARNAGLKVGDLILSIDGEDVYTNEQVSDIVKKSAGKTMTLHIKRDGIESDLRFCAVFSESERCYKAGIWVRDSSAGIGTLTFYDPVTKIASGLGHAVCDVDTGEIVPISSGEIVPARIYSVRKSESGSPGELRGGFEFGSYGPLLVNSASGVYSYCANGVTGDTVEIMLKQEIKTGEAYILTTVDGTQPQQYAVRITQIRHRDENATRNMIIEITDQRLLQKTGGIVQGMSGSPIIQNGKLVGAVTHVFVNDPTKGYAIFAENMLETAQSVAENNQLKDAS